MRGAALCALLAVLAGCRTVERTDLSAPVAFRRLATEPVLVAAPSVRLPIVTPDTPECRWAATFLADTIREICGRRPEILIETPGWTYERKAGLFLGEVAANRGWSCELTGQEAFRVVACDGCVRFLGRADYAVFDWCERALGVRFYGGLDGKCAERRAEIAVPAVDYSDRPVYAHRLIGGAVLPSWARVAKAGSCHRGRTQVHQPVGWHRDAQVKAVHPDIFENADTPMLCYGNPATLAYYKLRIDRHIAGLEDSGGIVNTNRKVVTVCQWDAPIRCACAHCAAAYDGRLGERGNASAIIWGRFVKGLSAWLAEAHPDYMISFLPYLNTCEVPREWIVRRTIRGTRGSRIGSRRQVLQALPGNAEAEPCVMPGLGMLKDAACRRREERILSDWRRATGRKTIDWQYECWPREHTSAPAVFGKSVQAHYAAMRGESDGSYVCGGGDDPRTALSVYVCLKCLWNPDIDVGAVYDEYARRMFGPAVQEMRELIDLQETCWNRPWPDGLCSFGNVFQISFPPEVAERMLALLQKAYARTVESGDKRAGRRVLWYAQGFEPFLTESAALAKRTERKVVRPGETNLFVTARSVAFPHPWAQTALTTSVDGDDLCFRVRCGDPAASKMNFDRKVDDFVWGNDGVTFVLEDDDVVKAATVYLTGEVSSKNAQWKKGEGFSARVTHDATGWTVEARVRLSARARAAGEVRGNVSRWRVGDRKHAESERVPGSRYEHTRLDTCFTQRDDDPAAWVIFRFGSSDGPEI